MYKRPVCGQTCHTRVFCTYLMADNSSIWSRIHRASSPTPCPQGDDLCSTTGDKMGYMRYMGQHGRYIGYIWHMYGRIWAYIGLYGIYMGIYVLYMCVYGLCVGLYGHIRAIWAYMGQYGSTNFDFNCFHQIHINFNKYISPPPSNNIAELHLI